MDDGAEPANPLVGIGLKVASTLVFTAMVTMVKIVEVRIPIGEVVFARAFFGIPPLLLWLSLRPGGVVSALRTRDPFGHVLRAMIGCSSMFLWFFALERLPLPDAQAINFAGPFFGIVLAVFILKERVRLYRWAAVLVGFSGVMIVLSEHVTGLDSLSGGEGGLGAVLALGSAGFGALAMIQVRRLTHQEGTGAIVFYFSAYSMLFGLVTLPFGWVVPNGEDAVLLVLMGLLGGVGQVLLTHSYRYAEASTIAPFDYTAMLWVLIVGYVFFDEVPSITVAVGAAVVIGSGVFVLLRERRLGIERARARSANTPS